jgi:hypothetical protein
MPYHLLDLDKVLALTKEERAYMAGLFDGEGCVSLSTVNKTQHLCVVTISQKRMAVLAWFHDVFGGSLFVRRRMQRQETRLGVWSIGDADTIRIFHRIVKPYLRIKAEEFELVVAYLNSPEPSPEALRDTMHVVRNVRNNQNHLLAVGE